MDFCEQLAITSWSQFLPKPHVSPGKLQPPWYSLVGQGGLEHTVQVIADHWSNFLMQVVEKPTRKEVWLDPVLTNQKGVVEDVKGSLGEGQIA